MLIINCLTTKSTEYQNWYTASVV